MLKGQKGNAKSYKGYCSGSSSIQCCIKTVTTLTSGTKLSNEGTCKNINNCPTSSNKRNTNQCPGSSNVKLCVPKSKYPISTDSRCGKDYNTFCPNNECCSSKNWCGTTNDHCSISKGCQSEFGRCTYNYRVGQRDFTFLLRIQKSKVLKVVGFLGDIFTGGIVTKLINLLTDSESILYSSFAVLGFKHVYFEIGNDVFEYTYYNDIEGVFRWTDAKKWNDENGQFQYNVINWDNLPKLQGTTNISPNELSKKIDRKKFPDQKHYNLKIDKIFSKNENNKSELNKFNPIMNNSHDFVQHCLELVGHPDTEKIITYDSDIFTVAQNQLKNMMEPDLEDLFKSATEKFLKNKKASKKKGSTNNIPNISNTIISVNGTNNSFKDDSENGNTFIDESIFDFSYDEDETDYVEEPDLVDSKIMILNLPMDTDVKDLINVIIERFSDLIKQITIPSKDKILMTTPGENYRFISILTEDHVISLCYHQTEVHSVTSEGTYLVGPVCADPGTWAVSIAMKSSAIDNRSSYITNDCICNKYDDSIDNKNNTGNSSCDNSDYSYILYDKEGEMLDSNLELEIEVDEEYEEDEVYEEDLVNEEDEEEEVDDKPHSDDETISDNNLNTGIDSGNEKPKDEDSGASYFKHFSFLNIFIILTSILTWQLHNIF